VAADVSTAVAGAVQGRIGEAARNVDKATRERQIDELKAAVVAELSGAFPEREGEVKKAFESELKKAVRRAILEEGIRPDGRRTDEIRQIWCQVGVLPRAHGSAIFTRGQTQALSIVTLGSGQDQQKLDDLGLAEF